MLSPRPVRRRNHCSRGSRSIRRFRRCPRAEYFDLRFRDRIYAKEPAEGSAPPAPRPVATPSDLPDTHEMPRGPRMEPLHADAGKEGV